MLTFERQQLILSLLEENNVLKLQELVDMTNTSESTIRRDLTELENNGLLKRIHGGATLNSRKLEEPTIEEKESKFNEEKGAIGKFVASYINDGDSIYLDAGTTTKAIVEHLKGKDIVVVTNGLNILQDLLNAGIKTYVVGGKVKRGTHAMIGRGALESIRMYQFDIAFIGTNGIDIASGYTTPDPEEAQVKEFAMKQANKCFVLADHTKFGNISFAKIADLNKATIITSDKVKQDTLTSFVEKTDIKVVSIR